MRILMVTDFYHPFVGGVEQHVRSLSTALVRRGHQVAVATLGQAGLAPQDDDQGVRVHRLQGTMQRANWLFRHPGRPWAPPFPDPEITAGLRHIVAREQPDIVHGHDWLARSFLPLKVWAGAPLAMSLHYYTLNCAKKSLMYAEQPCSGPGLAKCLRCGVAHYGAAKGSTVVMSNWLMGAAERASVDIFLPVSHATAEGSGLLQSGLPFQVIPNFVPDHLGQSSEDVTDYVAQLPPEPFLLFVGDLRRHKGLDVLLAAYQGLDQASAPPLVLIGKVWPETPATLPPGVTLLRDWPNAAVMAAWQRSMVAVVPSIWPEPFGIVVIEAMVSGRPVVASRIGGIPDMVADGETGLLVPPGDPDALRAALGRLIQDNPLRDRLGQAARHKVREFQASTVVPRFEQVYTQLCQPQTETRYGRPRPLGEHSHQ